MKIQLLKIFMPNGDYVHITNGFYSASTTIHPAKNVTLPAMSQCDTFAVFKDILKAYGYVIYQRKMTPQMLDRLPKKRLDFDLIEGHGGGSIIAQPRIRRVKRVKG